MEYNRPNVSMWSKEVALNYVCSLILPIDKNTEEVILLWNSSKKLRLNAELGKKLLHAPDSDFHATDEESSTEEDEDEFEKDPEEEMYKQLEKEEVKLKDENGWKIKYDPNELDIET